MRKGIRLNGGAWRGRRLRAFESSRPTQNKVKEAVFGRWGAGVEGARFLDLFCGGGGMAIEALSRGARNCCLVDRSAAALATVAENLEMLGAAGELKRLDLGAPGWARSLASLSPFDLIYLDPPYDWPEYETTLGEAAGLLALDGEMALEHASDVSATIPGTLESARSRRYGGTEVLWLAPIAC